MLRNKRSMQVFRCFVMQAKLLLLLPLLLLGPPVFAEWKPAGEKIKTSWAAQLDPQNVLSEYPRPIMEREQWCNLNGLWDYAIRSRDAAEPENFDGEILVPFAVESSLSGVQKDVGRERELWYRRTFLVPEEWRGKNVLLHFGAVDWRTEVFVNDVKVGGHTGGYAPFSFDITPYLRRTGAEKLVVKVWDPTSDGFQPRGKQVKNPHGIWYTPVTGIWQTVWLEPVNATHLEQVVATADIDRGVLKVDTAVRNAAIGDVVEVILREGEREVSSAKVAVGQTAGLTVPQPKLWSPDAPFLYGLEVKLRRSGAELDAVQSYAAMRKISSRKDRDGFVRFQLNNRDIFHFGPLDQGWWPDGLYTAPTDEALRFDIEKTKELGYNMIRKHVKTEPARWYTHCDRLGILVWQDMPNGDVSPHWEMHRYYDGPDKVRSAESEENFRREWREIMDALKPYPSIVVWVPFNEAWGQFKTVEITEWTKRHDPSRLVSSASGGNHYRTGDVLDFHKYPAPELMMLDTERVTVVGEYGGIGLPLKDHLWQTDKNWGYVQFKDAKAVTDEYVKYGEMLLGLVGKGISGAVYTQTTDVEGEVNGLLTYDRKVLKVEAGRLREINQNVIRSLDK